MQCHQNQSEMQPVADTHFVTSAKQGDTDAFAELVKRHTKAGLFGRLAPYPFARRRRRHNPGDFLESVLPSQRLSGKGAVFYVADANCGQYCLNKDS